MKLTAHRPALHGTVAMTVVLVVFSMLFATLLMAFCAFRLSATVWPPSGMNLPSLELPTTGTILIAASSVFYRMFRRDYLTGRLGAARQGYAACLATGLGFLITQALLWRELDLGGIHPGTNILASVIYGFSWIHAAHLIGALGLLLSLAPALRAGSNKGRVTDIEHIGKFWHLLTIVWLIMYGVIFLL